MGSRASDFGNPMLCLLKYEIGGRWLSCHRGAIRLNLKLHLQSSGTAKGWRLVKLWKIGPVATLEVQNGYGYDFMMVKMEDYFPLKSRGHRFHDFHYLCQWLEVDQRASAKHEKTMFKFNVHYVHRYGRGPKKETQNKSIVRRR